MGKTTNHGKNRVKYVYQRWILGYIGSTMGSQRFTESLLACSDGPGEIMWWDVAPEWQAMREKEENTMEGVSKFLAP